MTIRSPGQSPVVRPGGQQGTPGGATQAPQPTVADALTRLGMMGSGGDMQALANKLLSFLVFQGFAPKLDNLKSGGQPLDDAAKLAEALKNLQGKEGLPQTGKLDDKTLKAMEKYKPATTAGERATERQSASPDKQAGARQAASYRDQALAAWIKAKAPDVGKPQTTSQNAPPPPTVSAQQLQNSKQDANSVMQLAQQNAQTTTSQTQDQKGVPQHDPVNNPDARATQSQGSVQKSQEGQGKGQQGQGGEDGARNALLRKGTGKADDTPGGRSKSEEGLARGDADQLTAFEDGRGNQATGDEDEEDERRGAALVDDGSGKDEGVYEVPSVWEQVRKALREMTVEPQTDPNRPTCYRGDFVFYKPGVYQSRTQASQLINMKVRTATAYDDVWSKALEQINARIRVFEPGAPQLTMDDIHRALQVARARQS